MIANKLVNYASEINGKLEASIFKQLVSGEPVEARLPYGNPFIMSDYAKLIFNCNELPWNVEHTNAFYRRFLIIPFEVTIPEGEQDKELAKKIIDSELSGVFNWVLEGLKRLLSQKKFTDCEAVRQAREQYEKESDSVKLFLEESGYTICADSYVTLENIYREYQRYCLDDGYHSVSKLKFRKRIEAGGIQTDKKMSGKWSMLIKLKPHTARPNGVRDDSDGNDDLKTL
jgi:putative DNA primase/helicase